MTWPVFFIPSRKTHLSGNPFLRRSIARSVAQLALPPFELHCRRSFACGLSLEYGIQTSGTEIIAALIFFVYTGMPGPTKQDSLSASQPREQDARSGPTMVSIESCGIPFGRGRLPVRSGRRVEASRHLPRPLHCIHSARRCLSP